MSAAHDIGASADMPKPPAADPGAPGLCALVTGVSSQTAPPVAMPAGASWGAWSNPRDTERLITLWGEGAPLKAIAAELGVTKNAVVGRVHRLQLPARTLSGRPRKAVPTDRPRKIQHCSNKRRQEESQRAVAKARDLAAQGHTAEQAAVIMGMSPRQMNRYATMGAFQWKGGAAEIALRSAQMRQALREKASLGMPAEDAAKEIGCGVNFAYQAARMLGFRWSGKARNKITTARRAAIERAKNIWNFTPGKRRESKLRGTDPQWLEPTRAPVPAGTGGCQFPMWQDGERPTEPLFCGEPKHARGSYCCRHYLACFRAEGEA